nr:unnamed protein product [Mus musculus]
MTRHCLTHICQDTNQVLFKCCQGSEEVPCNKPVPVSLSEDPCCPLHFQLPPQMYKPEQDLDVVGDGMPCPPSPLLFDPSLTLEDHSVTESAGDAGQMQAAGDGCRSQGARSVEKAAFPQRGLATANGKPEPTSIS